jgi:hypothetical protein
MHLAPAREQLLNVRDRVRTPDGCIGEVIGFYIRQEEAVVVSFPSGESQEFPIDDVMALPEPS